jgi:rubrerythrin
MSMKDRIRRLKDEAEAWRCRECERRPPRAYVYYPDEQDYSPPEPEHCPECGRLTELICLRVEYDEDLRALGGGGG